MRYSKRKPWFGSAARSRSCGALARLSESTTAVRLPAPSRCLVGSQETTSAWSGLLHGIRLPGVSTVRAADDSGYSRLRRSRCRARFRSESWMSCARLAWNSSRTDTSRFWFAVPTAR